MQMKVIPLLVIAALVSVAPLQAASAQPLVIVDAKVADGTGGPLRVASVRVEKGRITDIGDFKPRDGETVIDGKGRVFAPWVHRRP